MQGSTAGENSLASSIFFRPVLFLGCTLYEHIVGLFFFCSPATVTWGMGRADWMVFALSRTQKYMGTTQKIAMEIGVDTNGSEWSIKWMPVSQPQRGLVDSTSSSIRGPARPPSSRNYWLYQKNPLLAPSRTNPISQRHPWATKDVRGKIGIYTQ